MYFQTPKRSGSQKIFDIFNGYKKETLKRKMA